MTFGVGQVVGHAAMLRNPAVPTWPRTGHRLPVLYGATMVTTEGTVTEFDDARGLGRVRTAAGSEHFFHCTAVADGSRHIDVGTPVRFAVVPGRRGRWEAADLVPSPLSPAS
jgi:cold shock CspA family protein